MQKKTKSKNLLLFNTTEEIKQEQSITKIEVLENKKEETKIIEKKEEIKAKDNDIEEKKKQFEKLKLIKTKKFKSFLLKLDSSLSDNQRKILIFMYKEHLYVENAFPISVFTMSIHLRFSIDEVNKIVSELIQLNYIYRDDMFSHEHFRLNKQYLE